MEKTAPTLFSSLPSRALKLGGYPGEALSLTAGDELSNPELYSLFANQFRIHSDPKGQWRGEFWGKFVRGASLTYASTGDERIYTCLADSVQEMLEIQTEQGNLTTYSPEDEYSGWDVWSRKYVILGFLTFAEIAKSKAMASRAISGARKEMDVLMEHVGRGKGKIPLLETSSIYGSLNSASLLFAANKLYEATGIKKYQSYARSLLSTGLCKGMDLKQKCLEENTYPYQWPETKAYEMTACVQGILEDALLNGDEVSLLAAKKFCEKLEESDLTLIGSCGTKGEFLDHSSVKQAESNDGIMQETCVTVNFMGLLLRLLEATGDAHYAELLERSTYNALLGAVNDTHQSMEKTEGRVWDLKGYKLVPHPSFDFDSYSPLCEGRRGKVIGGFMVMEDGHSFGCCAANGAYGTGMVSRFAIMESGDGYVINLYDKLQAKAKRNGKKISLSVVAHPYGKAGAKIMVKGQGEEFSLSLRIPSWAKGFKVFLNGEEAPYAEEKGYAVLKRVWGNDEIKLVYSAPIVAHIIENKVAFTRGAIVLARDSKMGDVHSLLRGKFQNGAPVRGKMIVIDGAKEAYEIAGQTYVDYSSAGKRYDEGDDFVSVFSSIEPQKPTTWAGSDGRRSAYFR